MVFEAIIGLEVHIRLKTSSKMFCRCPNRVGAEPNSLTCPICLGYPGTLPVLNRRAVDLGAMLALAVGAEVRERSSFVRKSYFSADLPKGYQISQRDHPLAEGGSLGLSPGSPPIRLRQIQLEEDAAKVSSDGATGTSRLDFNRSGTPLAELVTEPDLRCASQAQDFLLSLRQLLWYTDTSDARMDLGEMRCDVNVSVRPHGSHELGPRTEVKNLNSFRQVKTAVELEIARQTRLLDAGGTTKRESRWLDAASGVTRRLRRKESSADYRYLPEPDLPALYMSSSRLRRLHGELPELPTERCRRFVKDLGLASEEAQSLTQTPWVAEYFEELVAAYPNQPKTAANWVKNELLTKARANETELRLRMPPARLAELLTQVDRGRLSRRAGKAVLEEMWLGTESALEVAKRLGLLQINDRATLSTWIDEVLDEHSVQVERFRAGKLQLLSFFIGQVLGKSKGSADPRVVRGMLEQRLLNASHNETDIDDSDETPS